MQQLDAMTLQIAEIRSAMRSKRSHARERFFGDLLEPFPYLLCIAPTNRNNHSRLQRQRRCPACRNAVNVHKETVVAAHEVLRKALCHIFHGRIHLKDFMIGIYKHLSLCAFNIIDGIYGHDVCLNFTISLDGAGNPPALSSSSARCILSGSCCWLFRDVVVLSRIVSDFIHSKYHSQ